MSATVKKPGLAVSPRSIPDRAVRDAASSGVVLPRQTLVTPHPPQIAVNSPPRSGFAEFLLNSREVFLAAVPYFSDPAFPGWLRSGGVIPIAKAVAGVRPHFSLVFGFTNSQPDRPSWKERFLGAERPKPHRWRPGPSGMPSAVCYGVAAWLGRNACQPPYPATRAA
jgi:hypothetical protein